MKTYQFENSNIVVSILAQSIDEAEEVLNNEVMSPLDFRFVGEDILGENVIVES